MRTLAVSAPKTSTGNTHEDIEQKIWNFVVHVLDWSMKYYVLINTKEDHCKKKPYHAISPQKPCDCPAMVREGYQRSLEDSYHECIDDNITYLLARVNNIGW